MSEGTLPEGTPPEESPLRLRVRRVAGAPVVAIRVWLPGGQRSEIDPGIAWATGRMLMEGTARRDWQGIALEAESLGASIHGLTGSEVHGLAIDGLSADWEKLAEWALELITESAFPEDRLAWTVRQGQGELAALYDPPDSATHWAFLEQLYTPNPRCRPAPGSIESLPKLQSTDLVAFHRQALDRGPIITVAGRIDEERVRRRFESLFAGPVDGAVPPKEPVPARDSDARRLEVEVDGQGQAHLFLGHLTLPRIHPDYEALELAGVVLGAGAGLTGRIPHRVREQEGLAYTASADTVVDAGSDPGRATFYVGTAPENVDRAELAVREELERALTEGFSRSEVEGARTYLLGREPFRRETARQWASRLAESLYWGLPMDDADWCRERLESTTHEQVEASLRRHIDPQRLAVTLGT
ncbi:MAG: insulinase family protein [Thermoanaerobaculia bacterium]|nr:insulinase family protein [Thermoanaerobaculia bacterium]